MFLCILFHSQFGYLMTDAFHTNNILIANNLFKYKVNDLFKCLNKVEIGTLPCCSPYMIQSEFLVFTKTKTAYFHACLSAFFADICLTTKEPTVNAMRTLVKVK